MEWDWFFGMMSWQRADWRYRVRRLRCSLTCLVVYTDEKNWYSIRRLPKSVYLAKYTLMQDFPWMSEYTCEGVEMKKIGIPFAGYPRVYIWQSIHWCRIFLGCLNTLYFCFFDVFAWTYLMFYRFLVGLFETLFFVLSSQLPNNYSNNNNGGD